MTPLKDIVSRAHALAALCSVPPASARAIGELAEDLCAKDASAARHLIADFDATATPGARWLCSALLEHLGDPAGAAAVLDTFSDPESGDADAARLLARARLLLAASDELQAAATLKNATKLAGSYRLLAAADKLLSRLQQRGKLAWRRSCRVALLGNAIFDLYAPILRATAFACDIELDIYRGAFGQYEQELLDSSSPLQAFRPDVVIIAADWRALGWREEMPDPDVQVSCNLVRFSRLWKICRERWQASVIQHNFEVPEISAYGALSAAIPGGRARLILRLNAGMAEAAAASPGVTVFDLDHVAALYGKRRWTDPALWLAAKQYPAPDALPLLARHHVGVLRALLGLSAKCVALDLDGTLWGGVIGEDGLSGIVLGGSAEGEAFVEFQRYLKGLRQRGILLAVCSKNNEADAKLPFQSHPEMVLALDDIALFLANWQPKDEGLRALAAGLNIATDSLVFVDDNPSERAWIRRQLPEVEVPEMPRDPALFIHALQRPLYFEALRLTEDDRRRTDSYRANLERQHTEAGSASVDDFLRGLQMRVSLAPFDELNLPRITQLINKTNQFNLTTRRFSEEQVRGFMQRSGCYTQSMRLVDRFGDNGLTGILIGVREQDHLRIDTWLISCRVLGRRVEDAMLTAACNYAFAAGARRILGEYLPTAKNQQVMDLYDRFGFARIDQWPAGEKRYALPLSEVRPFPPWYEVNDGTQHAVSNTAGAASAS